MTVPPSLAAPGVYFEAPGATSPLSVASMDACAFVGVAPRGPARQPLWSPGVRDLGPLAADQPRRHAVPVAVDSFAAYRRIFGGFEGPGRLPYAVAAFFGQGGRRAYVVRVVPHYGDHRDDAGVASAALPGMATATGAPARLRARDEGAWGNRLSATLRFRTTVAGIEAVLTLDDGDGRREVHDRLGLSPLHPRWMAAVLCEKSALVWPTDDWTALIPDAALAGGTSAPFEGGLDRYQDLEAEHFFDRGWVPGDERAARGVHAIAELDEVGLLVVPDLYVPEALAAATPAIDAVSTAGADFASCVPLAAPPRSAPPVPGLDRLRLDPAQPDDLARIAALHDDLVELARQRGALTVLLDVPPRLHPRELRRWRGHLDSPFAAAYHPWLAVAPADDGRDALIRVNPSAFAAGIIAHRERVAGVWHGPANQVAVGAVALADDGAVELDGELLALGINAFRAAPDGVRLTSARTLSADPSWRQLSVRRLMTALARTLERQCQWMVFEPDGPALRSQAEALLRGLLRGLFRAGALAGAREEEAFFVRCAPSPGERASDEGRFLAEVGVAPAAPLEFLVVRLRCADAALVVEG